MTRQHRHSKSGQMWPEQYNFLKIINNGRYLHFLHFYLITTVPKRYHILMPRAWARNHHCYYLLMLTCASIKEFEIFIIIGTLWVPVCTRWFIFMKMHKMHQDTDPVCLSSLCLTHTLACSNSELILYSCVTLEKDSVLLLLCCSMSRYCWDLTFMATDCGNLYFCSTVCVHMNHMQIMCPL